MIRLVLDTTVLCADFHLSRPTTIQLVGAASSGILAIHVSSVSVAEAKRRYEEDLVELGQLWHSKFRELSGGRYGEVIELDVDGTLREARRRYPELLEERLSRNGIQIEPVPDVAHEVLVARDLQRRLPFRAGQRGQSYGYRDALIWETVLRVAEQHPNDPVVFVTDNVRDFGRSSTEVESRRDDGTLTLAIELESEVRDRLGDETRVVMLRSSSEVVNVVVPTLASSERVIPPTREDLPSILSRPGESRALLVELLSESAKLIRRFRFAPHFGATSDDYVPPDVDLAIPTWIDDLAIQDIDSPSDVALLSADLVTASDDGSETWRIQTRHRTTLYFDGFALKSDVYTHVDTGVHSIDRDWSERAVRVELQRNVWVTTESRCIVWQNEVVAVVPEAILSFEPISSFDDESANDEDLPGFQGWTPQGTPIQDI